MDDNAGAAKVIERVMETSQHPYLVIVLLMAVAVVFALAPLALAWLWARFFSPQKPGRDKNATYECGLESKGDAWVSFRSEYYLYAIIFLVFDVETIFLLPFAVSFSGLSVGSVRGHDGFSPAVGRRSGLGLAEGSADVEMTCSTCGPLHNSSISHD